MILVWVVVIVLIVWGVIALTRREGAGAAQKSPLDIARERYARGEISKEEYEEIRKSLS